MRTAAFALSFAVATGAAVAQSTYTFEMRLIPDGAAGAPAGPGQTYNLGNPWDSGATRVGFWLQARVSQTSGENWGIVRASSPVDGVSTIALSQPADATISRGSTNAANSVFGRGSGYRAGGVQSGNTDNTGVSQPFPSSIGNENGGLDNGGSGSLTRRVYGFNAWVGATRPAQNADDPSQPWNVNGANGAGSPIPLGVFSPWASLYRVWVDLPTPATDFLMTASAYLTGAVAATPTDASQQTWQMIEGPGQLFTASYSWHIPAPGTAAVLVFGGLTTTRRRRG